MTTQAYIYKPGDLLQVAASEMPHRWGRCSGCGPMVICGKCGNGTCNGGHGTLPDGGECDRCASAYEKYHAEYEDDFWRRMWVRREWVIHYFYIWRHALFKWAGY